MTDLRKAAEMALETLEEINKFSIGENAICLPAEIDGAMEALRQALAQPVDAVNMSQERVDETVKREHEPVAWVIEDGEVDYYTDVVAKIKPGTPLYTAPPKREWVGLSEKEMYKLWLTVDEETDRMAFGKAVEAKLKEKNT